MLPLPHDIRFLIDSDKTLGRRPTWDEESNPRYVLFVAPLTVGEVTTGGFHLRIHISKQFADRDAMAQLEYAPAGRRSAVPLWRVDWRRFHRHTNEGLPVEHAFSSFPGSHDHTFLENYLSTERRMRAGNLPAAWPLMPDPSTVSQFLAFCGERYRIKDMGVVRLPDLTADLFWTEDG